LPWQRLCDMLWYYWQPTSWKQPPSIEKEPVWTLYFAKSIKVILIIHLITSKKTHCYYWGQSEQCFIEKVCGLFRKWGVQQSYSELFGVKARGYINTVIL
jgi:hypothetical protein